MSRFSKLVAIGASGIGLIALSAPASAEAVYCAAVSTTLNYMSVDDSQVDACLRAGVGNIGQASHLDPFLNSAAGAGWTNVGSSFGLSFTQSGNSGGWSFSSSAWSQYAELAIGFKFGTGNRPDEWFVYSVADLISSGQWQFFNVGERGGGLSHLVLYGRGERSVPEPGTLGLLGLGLAGMGIGLRRRKR